MLTNTPPVGPPLVNVYDGVNLVKRTDPNGNTTHYRYDLRHRLKEVFYGATATGTPARSYGYDYVGNLVGVADNSMAASSSGAVTNASYAYDAMNRVVAETSSGLTHEYSYDLAGNRTKVLYASLDGPRRLVESAYDALGRVMTISEGIEGQTADLDDDGVPEQAYSRVTQYFYDGNGNVIKKILPNADVVETSYDALGRSRVRLSTHGGVLQNRFEQWYDLTGNVRRIEEAYGASGYHVAGFGDRRLELEYDGANRLLWERVKTKTSAGAWTVAAGATEYQYDAANNRTWKKAYSAANTTVPTEKWEGVFNSRNQMTEYRHWSGIYPTPTQTYTYDDNGNRVDSSTIIDGVMSSSAMSYDWENRLVLIEQVRDSDGGGGFHWRTEAYGYDYRTRRVSRRAWDGPMVDHDSNPATPMVPEPATEIENRRIVFSGGTSVREISASVASGGDGGGGGVEYIRGSDWGGGVGGILYTLRENGSGGVVPRFDHYNGRGDVVSQTDGAGATQWEAAYEAFGKRVREAGTTKDRQKANTKDEDPTGLLNEGMRYRDLETGVWLSRDPAGFVDGPNLYAYVTQNPWSKFDPLGLESHGPVFDAAWNWGEKTLTGLSSLANDTNPMSMAMDPVGSVTRNFQRVEGVARLGVAGAVHSLPGISEVVTPMIPGQQEFENKFADDFTGGEGNSTAYRVTTTILNVAAIVVPEAIASRVARVARLEEAAQLNTANGVNLRGLTDEAAGTLGKGTRYKSTAVGEYADGSLGVASSDTLVPRVQREWAAAQGVRVANGKGHAEMTLKNNATSETGPLTRFEVDSPHGRSAANPNGQMCRDCATDATTGGATTSATSSGRASRKRQ